jgi:hypothetical protein
VIWYDLLLNDLLVGVLSIIGWGISQRIGAGG